MTSSSTVFRCPRCGGRLAGEGDALLTCEKDHRFSVTNGVPRFGGDDAYARSFGVQWNRWSETQVDSLNGTSIFRDRFERYIGDPGVLSGRRVLDAGCGAGAFIDVVAPYAAEVVGFDLSASVDSAQRTFGHLPNVTIAQADIFSPPFAAGSFDFVYCIGVLQHTPEPERAFAALARLVRPGGHLGVWVYERSPWEPVKPRHLVRKVTARLPEPTALRFVAGYTPRAVRVRRRLRRLPGGRILQKTVPVADVTDYYASPGQQLTREQVQEWCLMDTHDMLITRYDLPQTAAAVNRWFLRYGFAEPKRSTAEAIAMVGVKLG